MLEAPGPVNCETIKREHGAITQLLRRGAYMGNRCGGKSVLLVSKSQSAVTVVSPYVNDALRIEGNRVLWAASYLCNVLSVERFNGDCVPIYASRGVPCDAIQ